MGRPLGRLGRLQLWDGLSAKKENLYLQSGKCFLSTVIFRQGIYQMPFDPLHTAHQEFSADSSLGLGYPHAYNPAESRVKPFDPVCGWHIILTDLRRT